MFPLTVCFQHQTSAVTNSSDGESSAAADTSVILEEAVLFCSTATVFKITLNKLRRKKVKEKQTTTKVWMRYLFVYIYCSSTQAK